jgi:hypothetical protein
MFYVYTHEIVGRRVRKKKGKRRQSRNDIVIVGVSNYCGF